MIQKQTLEFLSNLKENNNREWFAEHKDEYVTAHEDCSAFGAALWEEINTHDELEPVSPKKMVRRIYRDVRFSKDKTPYKTNIWGGFQRASKSRRGGYYFSIGADGLHIGAGFWGPDPADLLRIRKEFQADPESVRKILSEKRFKETWGELLGEEVRTAPKGFDREDPAIDLIRKKQFYFATGFTAKDSTAAGIVKKASSAFILMRPFYDYMTDVLTTDLDGRSLL